jgi:hypothetical protein
MKPCILVFGMPRSGTTWIGKLFDSHPDTLYRHEPDSVRKLKMPLFPEKEDAARYREELECFIDALPQMRSPEVVGKQPLFPKSYQSAAGLAAYRASVMVAKAASRARRHFPCLFRPTGSHGGMASVVWKSVESSGRLGACIKAVPQIRAIHLIRHPCGVMASRMRGATTHGFGQSKPKADNQWVLKLLLATKAGQARGVDLDEIQNLTPEEQAAWRWMLIQEKILADVAGSDRVLTIRYEDVCSEPIEMTRRMFEFAGLGWQSQTERFVLASTRESEADYYSVFKNSHESANRWRSELSPHAIERVQQILHSSVVGHFYNDELTTSKTLREVVS